MKISIIRLSLLSSLFVFLGAQVAQCIPCKTSQPVVGVDQVVPCIPFR